MGLSRKCVDAMRWKDMVVCYNDHTNNTIAKLRDGGSVKGEQHRTKEELRADGCFYDCGEEIQQIRKGRFDNFVDEFRDTFFDSITDG